MCKRAGLATTSPLWIRATSESVSQCYPGRQPPLQWWGGSVMSALLACSGAQVLLGGRHPRSPLVGWLSLSTSLLMWTSGPPIGILVCGWGVFTFQSGVGWYCWLLKAWKSTYRKIYQSSKFINGHSTHPLSVGVCFWHCFIQTGFLCSERGFYAQRTANRRCRALSCLVSYSW